jgi:hypothetical protein
MLRVLVPALPVFDLRDVVIGEIQLSRANIPFDLPRIPSASDCGSHRRIV